MSLNVLPSMGLICTKHVYKASISDWALSARALETRTQLNTFQQVVGLYIQIAIHRHRYHRQCEGAAHTCAVSG